MKSIHLILIFGFLLTATLLITGCTDSSETTYTAPVQTLSTVRTPGHTIVPTTQQEAFTFSDVQQSVDTSNPYLSKTVITGKVRNNLNTERKFVAIKAEFYDKDDVKLGFSADYIDSIAAGGVARFEITSLDKTVASDSVRYSLTAS
jgi:hypothetical protein